jgi:MobL relaxases
MNWSSVTPGVVLKTKFVTSDKKAFQEYVEYVDRDDAKKDQEAHEKLFSLYQDYMNNPNKTSSLFTERSDQLNEYEKKELKGLFETAQKITASCGKMSLHFIILGSKKMVYMTLILIQWMRKS